MKQRETEREIVWQMKIRNRRKKEPQIVRKYERLINSHGHI